MVQTKGQLGCLVHWHLMLVLASHLSKSANTFVNPFVTVDLLTATDWTWWTSDGRLANNGIDVLLVTLLAVFSLVKSKVKISRTRMDG